MLKFNYDDMTNNSIIGDIEESRCRYIIRLKSHWTGNTFRVFSSKRHWFQSIGRYQVLTTKI